MKLTIVKLEMEWEGEAPPFVATLISGLSGGRVERIAMSPDKAGNDASIFTGQVAKVFNHPVISTIALSKCTTTGYHDRGATGNELYGQVVSFNRNGCKWGWRRRIQVETGRIIERDQTQIISSLRLGFGRFTPTGSASGQEWADVLYYLAV